MLWAMPPSGCGIPSLSSRAGEARPFLGLVDRLEVAPEQRHAVGGKRAGKVERRLAAERHDGREQRHAVRRLGVDDAAHALRVERFEIEARRRVEVSRDGSPGSS